MFSHVSTEDLGRVGELGDGRGPSAGLQRSVSAALSPPALFCALWLLWPPRLRDPWPRVRETTGFACREE